MSDAAQIAETTGAVVETSAPVDPTPPVAPAAIAPVDPTPSTPEAKREASRTAAVAPLTPPPTSTPPAPPPTVSAEPPPSTQTPEHDPRSLDPAWRIAQEFSALEAALSFFEDDVSKKPPSEARGRVLLETAAALEGLREAQKLAISVARRLEWVRVASIAMEAS